VKYNDLVPCAVVVGVIPHVEGIKCGSRFCFGGTLVGIGPEHRGG